MSWGSWARRAYVAGSGFALASAAFLIVPIGSDAAPVPATPISAAPSPPLTLDLGGLAVSVGGVNIDVGGTLNSTPLGGVIASTVATVNSAVDSLTGATQPPATRTVPTPPATPPTTPPTSAAPTAGPQPTHRPTTQPAPAPTTTRRAAVPVPVAPRPTHQQPGPVHGTDSNPQSVSSRTRTHSHTVGVTPAAAHLDPAAVARHRARTVADQILAGALHPGEAALVLAAITALLAVGIASIVVSFGRRPGVTITGNMVD